MDIETLAFFDRDPSAMPLYEAFRDELFARWPGVKIKISRTQISFTDGVGFAFVSLPPRRMPGAILISLGLRGPLASERVFAQTEPYPGRWTVHILIHGVDELDEELLTWLDDAHEYAVERGAQRKR